MNDENIILLTDEDGEEIPYELLDDMILDDRRFVILAPAYDDEVDDGTVVIFEIIEEDGEETFAPVESAAIEQRVFDCFRASDEDYEFCEAE